MPWKPWLRASLASVHSEWIRRRGRPRHRRGGGSRRPPTWSLQALERKPLVTSIGWSPRACRIASSFHMVISALDLASAALTAPPLQSELQLFSSPKVKWTGVQSSSCSA